MMVDCDKISLANMRPRRAVGRAVVVGKYTDSTRDTHTSSRNQPLPPPSTEMPDEDEAPHD